MLWVDKYRPIKFDDLSYHDDITRRFKSLAYNPGQLPHLLIYGPSGAGKKTRINSLLRTIYGPGVTKLKLDKRTFTTPTGRTLDINMISSSYHIELSPGDAGLNDKYIVQDIIKEMASNKNIVASTTAMDDATTTSNPSTKVQYKIVVLMDVHKLSKQAQAALRRTMEKYSTTCRLILCCNDSSSSKVMEAVRSRCLGIRISSPSIDDICYVLKNVCQKESITLSEEMAVNIARESNRNLRRAILMVEACHVQKRDQSTLSSSVVPKTDWELYIQQLAIEITKEQTPQRLLAAREKMYELLVNCIPATVILKTLTKESLKNLDDTMKQEIIEWAAFYEHRIALGSKEIFHLEAFVAKYMAIYKRYLNELFG